MPAQTRWWIGHPTRARGADEASWPRGWNFSKATMASATDDLATLTAINDAQEQLIKASARIVLGVIVVIVTLAFFVWPSKKQLVAELLTKVACAWCGPQPARLRPYRVPIASLDRAAAP